MPWIAGSGFVGEERRLRTLVGKELGASLAALHDQLVKGGVEGNRVVAVETGHAEGVLREARGPHHPVDIKVADAVGPEVVADLLMGLLVGDELLGIGEVDSVVAGMAVRRAADAEVDLPGAGLAEIHHARLGGRAAHDGVVDDHDALALHRLADEVELHPDVEVADELGRLDEGAADVVVADESGVVGNSQFLGEAERGIDAGVGHGDDHVGLDGVEARQFAAHVDACLADGDAAQTAVGSREVDILEDAEGLARFGEGELGADSLVVDHDNLSRLEVADEGRPDQVKGAGFGGEDPSVIKLAEGKGAQTAGIAEADDFVLTHDHHGEGPFEAAQRADRSAHRFVGLGKEMENDLAVDRGLEDGSAVLKLVPQGGSVDEVAVVGDGELSACRVDAERLGVEEGARSRRRIADMADGARAGKRFQVFLGEDLRDQTHSLVEPEGFPVAAARGDAGALLTAVLQREEAVVGQHGRVLVAVDGEDAAFMFGTMGLGQGTQGWRVVLG